MRQHRGGVGAGRRGDDPGLLTRAVDRVFRFVRLAEFEIFFVLFFLIAFFLFRDLVSAHTNLAFRLRWNWDRIEYAWCVWSVWYRVALIVEGLSRNHRSFAMNEDASRGIRTSPSVDDTWLQWWCFHQH
jgi:hypothetical protein